MVTRKDLIIAVLATFCLTATLFMITPTRSNPSTSVYDPWVDTNDDGTIDIFDAIILAGAFGSTGTPINKTALLLELQSRMDSLNVSLLDLEAYLNTRIANLEASLVELQSRVDSLSVNVLSLMERINALEAYTIPFNSTSSYYTNATTETMNWVDMPDMSVTITLNRTSILLVMFSTEAKVQGKSPENWTDASIRIRALVGDIVAYPGDVYLTPTISQELGWPYIHGHRLDLCTAYSYTFYLPSVSEGTYTIKLQWCVTVTGSTGFVDSRTLTVIALPA